MARIDFTPMMILMVMTVGVVALKFLGTPKFKELLGQIDQLISQMFTTQAAPPTPAPTPPPPPPVAPTPTPTPAAEPEGITPATPPTSTAACDCSCMPMDSDPSRQKIETAAGEDCYNNVYPSSVEECEAVLVGVCASRGGGGSSSTPSSSGGEEEEEDEDEDEDEESGNLARVSSVGGFR